MLRFDDEVCVLQVGVRPCFLLYLSEKKQHIIDKFTISECSEALHRSFAPKETWMFLAGLFFIHHVNWFSTYLINVLSLMHDIKWHSGLPPIHQKDHRLKGVREKAVYRWIHQKESGTQTRKQGQNMSTFISLKEKWGFKGQLIFSFLENFNTQKYACGRWGMILKGFWGEIYLILRYNV